MKFEKTQVFNFEGALRGMRNPMNSWNKSDSKHCTTCYGRYCDKYFPNNICPVKMGNTYLIGNNDMDLVHRLTRAGNEHRKFLRQIFVSVDITAPLYWWKEFDTYKVGTVANSCSTMHKIHEKEFTLEDFSCEHLFECDSELEDYLDEHAKDHIQHHCANPGYVLSLIIGTLNYYREKFLETKDKKYWWQMIQLLPSSYNQMRTITMNYENLYSMIKQRKNHKLTEWSEDFINWCKSLPYAEELLFFNNTEQEKK